MAQFDAAAAYIAARRPPDGHDRMDYQTMFTRVEGSVAARRRACTPPMPCSRATKRGIAIHRVTLRGGRGPSSGQDRHRAAAVRRDAGGSAATANALNAVRAAGGRIVAVGSTSLRLIESASTDAGVIRPFEGDTALFITPGYRFRAVDVMMTNFHLPRSTLFMLVAAFSGLDVMKRAYAHAIEAGYRFYSYGDACLLFRS
jgi:S-adenosylmethionine:tRNA ribosyltransferase-isomerase